jgi:hypothetical protein
MLESHLRVTYTATAWQANSLVDTLGGGHGGVVRLDRLGVNRPVVEAHLRAETHTNVEIQKVNFSAALNSTYLALAVDPADGVLHPVHVVALAEVLARVRPPRLLARLRPVPAVRRLASQSNVDF